MSKNITINSKDYSIKNIDFNAICELEELGFPISDIKSLSSKPFGIMRACFAYHSGLPLELASKEIESHIINGGSFDDLTPFVEAIKDSDFFTEMSKRKQK